MIRLAGMLPAAPLLLALASCAHTIKDPWGLALIQGVSRGQTPARLQGPDSLQADLGITPRTPGAMPFSVRFYADLGDSGRFHVDSARRYRIDVFGFPSLIAASWLWKENAWILVRHDQRSIRRGTGAVLQPDMPLNLPDVHAVLGFLWGAPLPGFPGTDSLTLSQTGGLVRPLSQPGGLVRWTYRGEAWEARFDTTTGLCREVSSSSINIRYRQHRLRGGFVVPDEAEIFLEGKSLLTLRVREWAGSPRWKKSPFELIVPAGYREK
jgi:hypothetical protein